MSVDVFMICKDCKQRVWIGDISGSDHKYFVYSTVEHTEALSRFLEDHKLHHLVVMDDEIDNPDIQELFDQCEEYEVKFPEDKTGY